MSSCPTNTAFASNNTQLDNIQPDYTAQFVACCDMLRDCSSTRYALVCPQRPVKMEHSPRQLCMSTFEYSQSSLGMGGLCTSFPPGYAPLYSSAYTPVLTRAGSRPLTKLLIPVTLLEQVHVCVPMKPLLMSSWRSATKAAYCNYSLVLVTRAFDA